MGAVANLFPAYTEADWRKAAEAALKGASLETLVSETADGVRIEPVYPPAEGPRAISTRRSLADHRATRSSHRRRGQRPGARRPRQWSGRPADRVLRRARRLRFWPPDGSTPPSLHKAFDGVRFDAGANFELDLGPDGPDQALRFGALIERSGAKPEDCPVSFGLDPFAASARGPFPADWSAQANALCGDRARVAKQGFPRAVPGR